MRIVRFATKGHEHLGNEHGDGRVTLLEGDLFGELVDTGEAVRVEKRLAPLEPRDILCIGLNYRRHAEEGKQAIPAHPVLFMKNSGTVQNPGDPIVLPRRLDSREVDYECELAVVIGSETSGGVRNVFVSDCVMDSPNLDRAFRFKSNAVRGGVIENIRFRDIRLGQVDKAVLGVEFDYEEGANGPHNTASR